MTTPTVNPSSNPTGQIRFSQIISEFGPSNPDAPNGLPSRSKLGSYRVNQTIGDRNWRLDDGVPTSGSISFSQLRGKTLNVVVDYGANAAQVDSGARYDSYGVVVGGFLPLPSRTNNTHTKKVTQLIRSTIISTVGGNPGVVDSPASSLDSLSPNQTGFFITGAFTGTTPELATTSSGVGSGASVQVTGTQNYFLIDYTVALTKSGHNYHIGDTLYFSYGGNNFSARVASTGDILSGYDYPSSTYAAIKTNTWDSDTVLLKYLVTGTGKIYGNGGPGGLGGNSGASGLPGFPGSHCIGADNSCELVIESGGEVRAGGGGGGGGGGYYFNQNAIIGNYACSSRGGKGGKGTGWDLPNGPQNGSPPSNNCRGSGNNCNPGGGGGAAAGYGGNSGDWGVDGLSGCNATATKAPGETEDLGNGGSAGPAGAAIIRSDSNITVSVTNNGTISGATDKVGSFS